MDSDKTVGVMFGWPSPTIEVSGGGSALREAVDAARNGDKIVVYPGTYDGDISFGGKDIKLFSSNPDDPCVVAQTIIDCGFGGRAFVFSGGEGPEAVINGFTIINSGLEGGGGGAIYIGSESSPTIVNVVISNCLVVSTSGGAIYIGPDSNPTFTNVTVTFCTAINGRGGAIYIAAGSSPVFTNCTISNNLGSAGGGVYCDSGSSPVFTGCTLGGNVAGSYAFYGIGAGIAVGNNGGAVYHNVNSSSVFNNCVFNSNLSNSGGGIYYGADCVSEVNNCTFTGNMVVEDGGAVFYGPGSSITINGGSLTNNSAEYGGALYFDPNCLGTITDATLLNNEADEDGGAMYLSGSDILSIADCDISGNMAVRGGGLFAINSPQATITGCTINDNDAVRLIITYEYWIPDPNFEPDPNDPNAEPPYIPAPPDDPNFDLTDPNVRVVEYRDDSGIAQGGGIFSFRGPMSFADCQISYNTAKTSGGGVYLGGDSDPESPVGPELKNCLVARNKAGRDGGGISCNWYVEPTLSNCTLVGNRVTNHTGYGGGLYCSYQSDVEVIDTIIWNNTGANGSQIAAGSGDLPYPLPSTVEYGAVRPGFNAYTLPANDDGSTGFVNIGFDMNFFGSVYPGFFVNNNGNVTFDGPMWRYTPFGLTTEIGTRIIAPFFADVDTRTVDPCDPNNLSKEVTYGSGIVNGRPAFGINWVDVGYFYIHMDKLNSFQLILIDRSDRGADDFDMEFNYNRIEWETGDASLGVNGFGGFSARAGFSNGTGEDGTYYEFPGSGVHGAFLDSNFQTGLIYGSRSSTTGGRYIFTVEDGQPEMPVPASVPIYVEEGCAFTGFDPNDPNNPNGLEGGWVPAGNNSRMATI
ncbi:MAG: right-handed parallel beta-helix repeat-containing protein [Planctomycetota bacterium]|jgi:hypothetical protein